MFKSFKLSSSFRLPSQNYVYISTSFCACEMLRFSHANFSFRFASSLLNVSFTANSFLARRSTSVSVKHDHYVTCKRCRRQMPEQGCRSLIGWKCHAYSTFSLDTRLHGDDPVPPVIGHDVRCVTTPFQSSRRPSTAQGLCQHSSFLQGEWGVFLWHNSGTPLQGGMTVPASRVFWRSSEWVSVGKNSCVWRDGRKPRISALIHWEQGRPRQPRNMDLHF